MDEDLRNYKITYKYSKGGCGVVGGHLPVSMLESEARRIRNERIDVTEINAYPVFESSGILDIRANIKL